jgi:predicted DNA binding CopG/RHH family protein
MADTSTRRGKWTHRQRRKALSTSPQAPTRMKRLTLDLPEPLHRAIKKNAADEGVTMAQKLRTLLRQHYRLPE